jgi:hypothetical protein
MLSSTDGMTLLSVTDAIAFTSPKTPAGDGTVVVVPKHPPPRSSKVVDDLFVSIGLRRNKAPGGWSQVYRGSLEVFGGLCERTFAEPPIVSISQELCRTTIRTTVDGCDGLFALVEQCLGNDAALTATARTTR